MSNCTVVEDLSGGCGHIALHADWLAKLLLSLHITSNCFHITMYVLATGLRELVWCNRN